MNMINSKSIEMITHQNLTRSQESLAKAMESLSSGLKLNKATDTATSIGISEKLQTQQAGDVALQNQNSGSTESSGLGVNKANASGDSLALSVEGMNKARMLLENQSTNGADTINAARATMGAVKNRLQDTIKSLGNTSLDNINIMESRIRDTSMADEMMKGVKNSILLQPSMAMLAQGKSQPAQILQLLR